MNSIKLRRSPSGYGALATTNARETRSYVDASHIEHSNAVLYAPMTGLTTFPNEASTFKIGDLADDGCGCINPGALWNPATRIKFVKYIHLCGADTRQSITKLCMVVVCTNMQFTQISKLEVCSWLVQEIHPVTCLLSYQRLLDSKRTVCPMTCSPETNQHFVTPRNMVWASAA